MKKGFLTLILAGSLMSAGAENALTGTKFTDNWSVGINAGVTQPLAHPSRKRLQPRACQRKVQ